MKFKNEIPVIEVTYSGSNSIKTMKSELLRERNQHNQQSLNSVGKKLKGEAAYNTWEKWGFHYSAAHSFYVVAKLPEITFIFCKDQTY